MRNLLVTLVKNVQVDRMVKDAERYAKEDKEKRKSVVVYQTEKQLKELGDKVPAAVKDKVESKLKDLKDSISVVDSGHQGRNDST
ncbi:UNVERIFIED_CONTAM: hypothetical protein Sradi_5202200 [Sesamum radiatum]|uniref:Uncharacterized protein n=1 Tax=Sesamum radiatum TaxID=300843 RepID=A0AAW2M475_SESRA